MLPSLTSNKGKLFLIPLLTGLFFGMPALGNGVVQDFLLSFGIALIMFCEHALRPKKAYQLAIDGAFLLLNFIVSPPSPANKLSYLCFQCADAFH